MLDLLTSLLWQSFTNVVFGHQEKFQLWRNNLKRNIMALLCLVNDVNYLWETQCMLLRIQPKWFVDSQHSTRRTHSSTSAAKSTCQSAVSLLWKIRDTCFPQFHHSNGKNESAEACWHRSFEGVPVYEVSIKHCNLANAGCWSWGLDSIERCREFDVFFAGLKLWSERFGGRLMIWRRWKWNVGRIGFSPPRGTFPKTGMSRSDVIVASVREWN